MKNKLLRISGGFILTFLIGTICLGKGGNQLLLKTGAFTPERNLSGFIATSVDLSETINGRYYRIIQFESVPGNVVKAGLEQAGITFLSYLPEKAFYVSIPYTFDRNKLQNQGIRSILPVKKEYKLSGSLLHPNYPAYALSDNDSRIDLVVQYFSDLTPAIVLSALEGKSMELRSRYDYSRLLHIRIPISAINEFASLPYIKWMEITRPPSTPDDTKGRGLHRANAIASDYALGRHYDGTGVNVVLGDDGLIGPHIDFTGRLDNSNATGFGPTHGDMTGGIMVGCGNLNPIYRGMATGAYLYNYDVGPYNHLTDMPVTKTTYNVRIASTSYSQGFSIGNGCNEYNSDTQTGDQIMHQNPELLWVFSAGNNGTADCYNAGNGWGNITGGFKNGKNVIAVGNLNYLDVLETSSSRGPANDGRIKPDICANGIDQMSTDEGNTYQVGGGTSAASPGIAGITAQLYQAYRELNGGADPDACLLKACMLNTAQDIGNPGPDFKHGWGRVNALRAVMTLEDNRYFSDSLNQGDVKTYTISVAAGVAKLKVMLYWLDVEGDPAAAKSLVNDADLTVTDPFSVVLNPYKLDPTPNPTNLNLPATTGVDDLNNMEQVELDFPSNGTYTITVSGTSIPQGPQKFYIVYETINDEVTVTYPMGGESFVPGEFETIRWDSYGPNANFDLEYSTDNGGTWNTIQLGVFSAMRAYDWAVPATITGQALVRVTRGAVSGQSQNPFSIMNVLNPNQILIDYACPDSMQLSWFTLNNATSYQVYKLGAKYMDSIAVTTATSIVLYNNYNPNDEYWFSVSGFGQNGASGRRSIAVKKDPGLVNCVIANDAGVIAVTPPNGEVLSSCDNLASSIISISVFNGGQSPLTNVPVYYSVNNGPAVSETFPGPLAPGANFYYNFTTTVDLSAIGTYNLKVWAVLAGDGNKFNDTLDVNFETVQGVFTVPWSEDFETFDLCSDASDCDQTVCTTKNGFRNEPNGSVDNIDWRTDEDGTPSQNTGPDVDHNPGTTTGNYMYTEASNGCNFQEAELITPCIDLTGTTNPEFTYWYHMNGANMGVLHTDLFTNGTWTNDIIPAVTGDQGDVWLPATVNLSSFIGQIVKFRIRGITGSDYDSDMAIDDFGVADNTSINDPNAAAQVFVSPNPGNGLFNVFINRLSDKNLDLAVFDMQGRQVYSRNFSNDASEFRTRLDLSNLARGVYNLRVISGGKVYMSRVSVM